MELRYLVLISDAEQTCGVEEFTRQLARRMQPRALMRALDGNLPGIVRMVRNADGVILNFPIVAWKRRLLSPIFVALVARIFRRDVVVVLHEWLALDWKRRLVLSPVALLASRIYFSAPEIASEFAGTRLSALAPHDRRLLPVPPNLLPPAATRPSRISESLSEQRRNGRFIIGQFGSIYPKKQSTAVLEVAACLLSQGHDVGVVFAGSFIKGMDNVEEQFFDQVRRLGLADRVQVTGYIAGEDELFAIFEQVDVFCYLFQEGLTSRRGSVLAAALSGKPVVVNAAERSDTLAHHGLFQSLLATHALRLVETNADIPTVAAAVLQARETAAGKIDFHREVESMWRVIAADIDPGKG